jgi:hypothetical protein
MKVQFLLGNSKNILLDCDSQIETIGVTLMYYYNILMHGMQQTNFASEKPVCVAFLPMLHWRGLVQPLHALIIIDSQWCLSYNFFNKKCVLVKITRSKL